MISTIQHNLCHSTIIISFHHQLHQYYQHLWLWGSLEKEETQADEEVHAPVYCTNWSTHTTKTSSSAGLIIALVTIVARKNFFIEIFRRKAKTENLWKVMIWRKSLPKAMSISWSELFREQELNATVGHLQNWQNTILIKLTKCHKWSHTKYIQHEMYLCHLIKLFSASLFSSEISSFNFLICFRRLFSHHLSSPFPHTVGILCVLSENHLLQSCFVMQSLVTLGLWDTLCPCLHIQCVWHTCKAGKPGTVFANPRVSLQEKRTNCHS